MVHEHPPEYIAARRILLDALGALQEQRKAVVLVGAQAIYLRVGAGSLQVAPYTTDGDLALNPAVLDDEPLLAEALSAAGFSLAIRPGTWSQQDVHIDLMFPTSLAGSGRRSARLGPHGTEVARKANGLELALIDNNIFTLSALDSADSRSCDVAVAGLGALLVGKLHKLAEREDNPDRWIPKDGLDILRILQGANLRDVGLTLSALERHPSAGHGTRNARQYLRRLFASRRGHGVAMAIKATVGLEDAEIIAGACNALAAELLTRWNPG